MVQNGVARGCGGSAPRVRARSRAEESSVALQASTHRQQRLDRGRRRPRAPPGRRRPACHSGVERGARPALAISAKSAWLGFTSPVAMPSTTTSVDLLRREQRVGLAQASSALSSDWRGGGKNCGELAGVLRVGEEGQEVRGRVGVLALREHADAGLADDRVFARRARRQRHQVPVERLVLGQQRGARDLRDGHGRVAGEEVGGRSPGPGIALSVKIASWMKVIASTIGLLGRTSQVLPSALHGVAPQPFQTEARLCQVL